MACRRRIEPDAVFDRAAFLVGRRKIQPADTRERYRCGTHRTGLQRHVEISAGQTFACGIRAGEPDRQHLRMRRWIAQFQRPIACRRDHLAVAYDDRADGDFATRRRRACLVEGQRHEIRACGIKFMSHRRNHLNRCLAIPRDLCY